MAGNANKAAIDMKLLRKTIQRAKQNLKARRKRQAKNVSVLEVKIKTEPGCEETLASNNNSDPDQCETVVPVPAKRRRRNKTMSKKQVEESVEETEKMKFLLANFSEQQLAQFEAYRTSAFPKAGVRKIIQGVTRKRVTPDVVLAISGIAKVFVGEIIEEAVAAKECFREEGPIRPKHIRDAVFKLKREGKIKSKGSIRNPFPL